VKTIVLLIMLFPIAGSFINALAGRRLPRIAVEVIACGAVLASLGMAGTAFVVGYENTFDLALINWFSVNDLSVTMNVHYDPLAAIMALMVTFVSGLIHVYSVKFMRNDTDYVRYFFFLNLFVFAMLVIVLADNLIFLYLGWEGVGFCSYALIGFWYVDLEKATAGRKAFLLTRVGDVAFGVAIALVFFLFHHLTISYINAHSDSLSSGMATFLGLLLLWAAVGKSAQLPLSVWLPDAMAGPTPVSALIHAATMVTAGVYLLMRLFPVIMLSPAVMLTITCVAALTAFYSACAALGQTDIKRILAYSTMSQVAYMFLGVGAGDIVGGMFLLLSHAFFKALLFLVAGCVIQALGEEHDIFKMGNLRKLMPVAYWLFLAGALSLSAIPPFGGYFSKSRILLAVFMHPEPIYKFLWFIAFVGALLTPLYTMRMFFIAFPNRPIGPEKEEILPIPGLMVWITLPLAVMALLAGALNLPFMPIKQWLARYLSVVPGTVVDIGASPSLTVMMSSADAVLVISAAVVAYFLYRRPAGEPARQGFREALSSAFYLDKAYHNMIVVPYQAIAGFLWMKIDTRGIDESIERMGLGFGSISSGFGLWASGRLSTYLKMFLLGFAAILIALAMGWFQGLLTVS
jgi:NADH-quinone oxidoreductase subunit L